LGGVRYTGRPTRGCNMDAIYVIRTILSKKNEIIIL